MTHEAENRLIHQRLPQGMKLYSPKARRSDHTVIADFTVWLEPWNPEISLVNYRIYKKACTGSEDYNASLAAKHAVIDDLLSPGLAHR
jgi:hypothetical protein